MVEVPLPGEPGRLAYINQMLDAEPADGRLAADSGDLALSREVLAQTTNGMTLRQIAAMVRSAHAEDRALGLSEVGRHKRDAIEAEIGAVDREIETAEMTGDEEKLLARVHARQELARRLRELSAGD